MPPLIKHIVPPTDGFFNANIALKVAGGPNWPLGTTIGVENVVDVPVPLNTPAGQFVEPGVDASTEVGTDSLSLCPMDLAQPDVLIVMRSHGRGGLRRWSVGSVVQRLLREVVCLALLAPPKVTP